MSHTVDTTTTDYTWDIAAGLPVVLQDGTNTYVYGLDLISATDGSGDPTYFTYDGLGSATDLTDSSANIVATYSYDVFGAIRSLTGSSGNYWLFTGEQQDSDSELYFLRARYYDPVTGRFLGKDPLPIGNRYSYVSNNPLNYVDPYGLFGLGDIVDCVGDPIECGEDVIDAAAEGIGEIFDQIHITLEGVLVGGVLVVVGAVLTVSGMYVCTIIFMEELPNPATWPVVPHSLGICGLMVATGIGVYACGWALILTSWCAEPLPADTAEAAGPAGPGKE